MDYKELIDILRDETNPNVLDYIDDAVTAINDLLDRVETAEAERDEARRDCAVAEQNHQIEVERRKSSESRAGKAERERDYAIKQLKIVADENGGCWGCKWFDDMTKKCTNPEGMVSCNTRTNNMWEWRGLKEE